jgi:hypothetical protein
MPNSSIDQLRAAFKHEIKQYAGNQIPPELRIIKDAIERARKQTQLYNLEDDLGKLSRKKNYEEALIAEQGLLEQWAAGKIF